MADISNNPFSYLEIIHPKADRNRKENVQDTQMSREEATD